MAGGGGSPARSCSRGFVRPRERDNDEKKTRSSQRRSARNWSAPDTYALLQMSLPIDPPEDRLRYACDPSSPACALSPSGCALSFRCEGRKRVGGRALQARNAASFDFVNVPSACLSLSHSPRNPSLNLGCFSCHWRPRAAAQVGRVRARMVDGCALSVPHHRWISLFGKKTVGGSFERCRFNRGFQSPRAKFWDTPRWSPGNRWFECIMVLFKRDVGGQMANGFPFSQVQG